MILQCRALAAGYGKTTILRDISTSFAAGRMYGVLGPNGCGKTTFLRTLAGLQPPLSGQIVLQGQRLEQYSSQALAQRLAVVLTDRLRLDHVTGYEVVAMGRYPYTGFFGRLSARDHSLVRQYLTLCQADALADIPLAEMSDGQRQKILLARGLVQETPILLLDEPTSHLDLYHKLELLQILREICQKQQRLVITTLHEPELALKSCDAFLCIGQGRLLQQCTVDDNVALDHLSELYGLQRGQFDVVSGLAEFYNPHTLQVIVCGSDLGTPALLRRLQQLGIGYGLAAVAADSVAARIAWSMGCPVQQTVPLDWLRQAKLVLDYTSRFVVEGTDLSIVPAAGMQVGALDQLLREIG